MSDIELESKPVTIVSTTKTKVDYKSIFSFYLTIVKYGFLISIPVNVIIILFSFLPWTETTANGEKPNSAVVNGVLCFSITLFGPIYIIYYSYLIKGVEVLKNRTFLAHVAFQSLFWPLLYTCLLSSNIFVWYYYLDFAYFLFAFLPLSFHTAYSFLYTPNKNEGRIKFAITYAVVELVVILGALVYTWILIPIFIQLDLVFKIIWRLFLHPFYFEATMLFPQRILSKSMPGGDPSLRFLPALHAILHATTIGRMILLSVDDIVVNVYLNFLINAQEIVMRISVLKRDSILKKWYTQTTTETEVMVVHTCVINSETLMELVGIFSSPVLMMCFAKWGGLFTFNGQLDMQFMLVSTFLQLILELLTDIICILYETQIHGLKLIELWNYVHTKKMLGLYVYGTMSMGFLGMLYTGIALPRVLYCPSPTAC